ncbi:MAG: transglutaminase domain-containing protein, partial [Deltaproteobacteria bacterium]|nr:transglutaminase domain-containing protein [Deltaproteobacteria bacterium]
MKKPVIYKILGVLIVFFWLFVVAELVKRTNFNQKGGDVTHIDKKGSLENRSEEWKEIFLKGRKVGYTVTRIKAIKDLYEVNEEIFLTVNLMGSTQEILSSIRAELDKEFLLNSFDFSLSSGLIEFKIFGTIKGNNLYLSMGEKGKEETKFIRLPSKPMISAGITQFFKSCTFKIGDSYHFPVFDPVTMTTNPAVIKVVAKEVIEINRLEMNFLGRPMIFWIDEKGGSLKEKGFMGFTLVRSSSTKAPLGLDRSKRIDFYELSAIKVTQRLTNPRELSYLKVLFDQTPSPMSVNGPRQSLTGKVLTVTKEIPPFKASYAIPYNGKENRLLHFLRPEMLIQSDDQEIISLARGIVKETTDPFLATQMIMGWVFENLEKVPVVSIPNAKEVVRYKKGDCNEHATILTALLRAVGIPARIVVGLVYKDGKFYYHAWNEA